MVPFALLYTSAVWGKCSAVGAGDAKDTPHPLAKIFLERIG